MVDGWKKEPEAIKKKDEEREKLLEKCKNKLKKTEKNKENEIFNEEDLRGIKQNNDNDSNDKIDDLPELEIASKDCNYNNMREKSEFPQNNHINEVKFNEKIETNNNILLDTKINNDQVFVEEMIDTNIEKTTTKPIKIDFQFEELD